MGGQAGHSCLGCDPCPDPEAWELTCEEGGPNLGGGVALHGKMLAWILENMLKPHEEHTLENR